jgi:hypothetical protein
VIDYYEVLQVSPHASQEIIEAAYKRLAKMYHPDAGGSEEKMKELNEAHDTLSDTTLRNYYDSILSVRKQREDSRPQSQDQIYENQGTKSIDYSLKPRPWVRYFARMTDIFILTFISGIILAIFGINAAIVGSRIIFISIAIIMASFIESILLCTLGTTPGKWLLSTKVLHHAGNKPTFVESFKRFWIMYVCGCGLGIPLLSLITLWYSMSYLVGNEKTYWDQIINLEIRHQKLNWIGIIGTIIVLVAILYISIQRG